jgi:hypothetical protein
MNDRYVLLDMNHILYLPTMLALKAAFEAETGRGFSAPCNAACTRSWAKVTVNVSATVGGAILEVEDGSNSRAMADISDPDWGGEPA